ncbi:MAG TPA: hypothetical protein EYQ50_03025 [Verrucomicrobiales bacterium]|nr:hypothetical protein [Verrucomicrobiales bacterium]
MNEPSSSINGMLIIESHRAKTVLVHKRSMAAGFPGVFYGFFCKPNTRMSFRDAKEALQ